LVLYSNYYYERRVEVLFDITLQRLMMMMHSEAVNDVIWSEAIGCPYGQAAMTLSLK